MIRTLPNWYGKVEDEIRRNITLLANKENIRWRFVHDSKSIDESINNIMCVLLRLKEEVKGQFNEEEVKKFEKLEESIEKEETEKKKSNIKRSGSKPSSKKRNRKTNKKV